MKDDIYEFYKENPKDKIWKVTHYILHDKDKGIVDGNVDRVMGEVLFSFDKKKIYNAWTDYPYKLTQEEKELFDKENQYWADFFKDRCEKSSYEEELKKLQDEFKTESEIALQESDKLYDDMVKRLGHKNFLSQSINKPIMECEKKYKMKLKELKEKYKR